MNCVITIMFVLGTAVSDVSSSFKEHFLVDELFDDWNLLLLQMLGVILMVQRFSISFFFLYSVGY